MSENYPLEQLLTIKKNRFEQAQKTLEEKKQILEKEKEELVKVEKKRDEVLNHKNEKLTQLRDEQDEGTTPDKIKQMKSYLETVEEKLLEKQRAVDAQIKKVKHAEEQVEIARQDLFQKQKDLEKLKLHRGEWTKEVKQELQKKEISEQDDLGSMTFRKDRRGQINREKKP